MAYEASFNEEDEENEQNQGEQVLAGESSEVNNNQPGSQQNASANAPTKSGSWTNLLSYVDANKGQDAAMGDKLKSGISQRAGDAQSSAGQFQQRANERVAQNTVQDEGVIDELNRSPSGIKNDADRRAQFDKQWSAYYGGPEAANEVEGFGEAQQKFNTVQDRAKTAQTHAGREALLSDEYGRPSYTKGEKQLDSFILGAGQGGTEALANINQNYSNYAQTGGWNDLVNSVNQNIGQAKQTTAKTQADTRASADAAKAQTEQNFADALARDQAERERQLDDFRARVSARDEAALAEAGLNPGFSFPDINQLITGTGDRSIGDVASPEEIANYQALLELSGLSGNYNDFSKSGIDSYYQVNHDLFNKGSTGGVGAALTAQMPKAMGGSTGGTLPSFGDGRPNEPAMLAKAREDAKKKLFKR